MKRVSESEVAELPIHQNPEKDIREFCRGDLGL
jgi:hypothetical protein